MNCRKRNSFSTGVADSYHFCNKDYLQQKRIKAHCREPVPKDENEVGTLKIRFEHLNQQYLILAPFALSS